MPVLLDVVEVFVFFVSLRLFILVLWPVLPVIEPLFVPVPVPRCIVPSGIVPIPCWGDVVMLPLLVVLVPAGVVWAKAAVLKENAHAAVTKILVTFMRLKTGRRIEKAVASHSASGCLTCTATNR